MKFRSATDEDVHLSLTSGHTCIVTPQGTDIDARFHREAIASGRCIPVGIELPQEAPAAPQFDRAKVIQDGIRKMLDSDEEGLFTATGRPNASKLNAIIGFKADREEIDAAWAVIEAEITAAGEGEAGAE